MKIIEPLKHSTIINITKHYIVHREPEGIPDHQSQATQ